MVRFERRTLFAKQIDVDANLGKTVPVQIPRDKFIRNIILRLSGELRMQHATAIDFQGHEDNPMTLIKNVKLIKNGGDTLRSVAMSRMYYMDCLEYGTPPERTKLPDVSSGTDVTNSFVAVANLDFQINPRDKDESYLMDEEGNILCAMLPAHTYSSLDLEVEIGTAVDLEARDSAASGVTLTVQNATLDITLVEAFFEDADPELTEDEVVELVNQEIEVTNIQTEDERQIEPTMDCLIRRYAMFTYGGSPLTRDNDVISRYKIKQSSPVSWTERDVDWKAGQAEDKAEYGVESLESGYPILKGLHVCDFDNNRTLQGALDAVGLKSGDLKIVCKTTAGTGRKIVVVEQIVR